MIEYVSGRDFPSVIGVPRPVKRGGYIHIWDTPRTRVVGGRSEAISIRVDRWWPEILSLLWTWDNSRRIGAPHTVVECGVAHGV